jgi:hypothetical protein
MYSNTLPCTVTTNQITRRLQTFINKCLRQITNIKWTDKDYKRRTMKNYQTEANRNSDKKKKMELDWTHIT